MKRPKLHAEPVVAFIALSTERGMRRNSVIQIVVVLAALLLLVLVVGRWQRNPLALEHAGISSAAEDPALARHTDIVPSLSDTSPTAKLSFTHLSGADGLSYGDVRATAAGDPTRLPGHRHRARFFQMRVVFLQAS